jgi:DmsE family decaheme c-type cytochrome
MHTVVELGPLASSRARSNTVAPANRTGRSRHELSISLASALAFFALLVVRPVGAQDRGVHGDGYPSEIYSELMSYVQQLGDEQPSVADASASPHNYTPIEDQAYSALRSFVREIGAAEDGAPGAIESPHGSAPAGDETYAALRDFVREIGGAAQPAPEQKLRLAQAAPPKAPKAAKAKAFKAEAQVGEVDAHAVGSQVCMTCHAAQAAKFALTVMGKIGKVRKGTMECENCHGPGSLHVKAGGGRGVGGMITFRNDDPTRTPEENNAICLTCHERGSRTLWRGSTHETRGVACTNCHTIMTNVTPKFQLAKGTEVDTCFQCHANKRAQMWRTSHMPVREGKMTCSSCHNPHGTYGEALLKTATINDTCYQCHAEKRGPFLWEHPPVRENCDNCHDPHGSINDFSLKISRPRLCQQCHANLTGHPGNPRNPTSIYAINRECQNCHSQHHGSNSPSGSRFIR